MPKLRCRSGDIAIGRTKNKKGHDGRMVRVLRPYVEGQVVDGAVWGGLVEPSWVVESLGSPFMYRNGPSMICVWVDRQLTPLRGRKGKDEMLVIAGKPEGAHA